ncbi:hypothetical protein, partial [Phocaeicola barnesiae]|uniref:hypothetical protein n=1 Tax=Phocaeicola barnesiae TaxID=376804 RepID=UPI0005905F51
MNLLSHIPTCKRYYKSSAKTLVVSFIGFQTQKVDVKSNVNVVLKSDAEVLDEVMVVAYGTA